MIKRILRYLIALIFIASGFVKAIDPIGFSFKLEEYFSPSVFNIAFLEKYSLALAIIVSALEMILGVMLLLKIQLKKTLICLIALCIFFAFLTFYSAYYNAVTDCGCFGDAIKFSPWQSFFKDIALLGGLIFLWFSYKNSLQFQKPAGCIKSPILWMSFIATTFIIYWGIKHEPLIDFRDYKIGTNLNLEKQKIEKNPSQYTTVYVLKNQKTGEEKKISSDDYVNDKTLWEEGTPWKIENDKTTSVIVKAGYQSEIGKFKLIDQMDNDFTDQILHAKKAVLVFSYDSKKLSAEQITSAENKVKGNTVVYGISNQPNTFKQIPNLIMDGTAIKTIARSNPFVLVLENGIIVEKKSIEDYK